MSPHFWDLYLWTRTPLQKRSISVAIFCGGAERRRREGVHFLPHIFFGVRRLLRRSSRRSFGCYSLQNGGVKNRSPIHAHEAGFVALSSARRFLERKGGKERILSRKLQTSAHYLFPLSFEFTKNWPFLTTPRPELLIEIAGLQLLFPSSWVEPSLSYRPCPPSLFLL